MAKDYARLAKRYLGEAENALSESDNATCVRRSQEALEMAARAVLRRLAIEYPREHDVSEAVDVAAARLPPYLRERVAEVKAMLVELERVRGPAAYGYEDRGIPPSEAFTREYGTKTFEKVHPLVELCTKFASE